MKKKLILSIETSGKVCSVALVAFCSASDVLKYELISEYNINIGNKHDRFCAELCNRIIKDNGYIISDISAVAVSIGPGSFTGLRIGVAIAKGICFDFDNEIPLIAVPTLTALANKSLFVANIFKEAVNILAIIPSHNNLVYHQLFDKEGKNLSDIGFCDLNLLQKCSDNEINNLIITTNTPLEINFGNYISELSSISAFSIAKVGITMYINQEFTNSIDICPLYIQDFIPR